MCVVDGNMKFILIPHVYRQEVYAGNGVDLSPYYDGNLASPADPLDVVNTSPVNFFAPDMEKFKKYVHTYDESVLLRRGDCLFIPAYYYY